MTQPMLEEIQVGWKVYAGEDEVGDVTEVRSESIDVRRGTLIRHEYRIPAEYVAEVSDGIIDLNIDRATVDGLEVGAEPPEDDLPEDELPEEYRRLESRTGSQRYDDPRNSVTDPLNSVTFHH